MKNALVSYVGWLLIAAALAFYGYAIVYAIILSWPLDKPIGKDDYNPVLSTTIGSIQALLLANLGMVLGISVASPGSNVARALKLDRGQRLIAPPPPPMDLKDNIQLFAVLIYIIGLIACSITWVVNNFSTNSTEVVPLIAESGKMFIGVFLAYVTAILR